MRPPPCLRSGSLLLLLALAFSPARGVALPEYPGRSPGATTVTLATDRLELANDALTLSWRVADGQITPAEFLDRRAGQRVTLGGSLFEVQLADGRVLRAADLRLAAMPVRERITPTAGSPRAGEALGGWRVRAAFADAATGLEVRWQAELRDGASYVRQQFDFAPTTQDLPVKDLMLLEVQTPGLRLAGTVSGTPVVTPTFFAGIEDPMYSARLTDDRAVGRLLVGVPLRRGQHFVRGTVLGLAPAGQLRRAFLAYLERERAHPYRPFLHYNSWWDIGMNTIRRYTEAECLDRIQAFGRELVQQRGVVMDSVLFDDGWDDTDTVWEFTPEFPHGFTPLREAAAKYGIGLGIWLSPFGGYNGATGAKHTHRTTAGKAGGYELNEAGFALSGAKYYTRFRDVTVGMIRTYGVNMFKFDGLSRNTVAPAGSPFSSDFQAAIQLLGELRAARGDVFINLTTGTWPSPFWTLLADSIWRGGRDSGLMGVGTKRQQWMTFRDGLTYQNVVTAGELYPLNSLMTHGIIYCRSNGDLRADPAGDLPAEVRSYFGSGTQLQELYCTPALLKPADWDTIAASAKWARAWADVLVDTHWVGGDPRQLQVYGWAAWAPRGATLTLRNPSDKPQEITLDAQSAFELPTDAPTKIDLRSPYADQRVQRLTLDGAKKQTLRLEPFEVLVFNAGR
ncbi:enterotoxin [Opitutus sp. ER46]|uniref:enterotoxin n=1 Tax=Opitutus sp. ER46 TaxID=2161864 RepID=UPI000D2FC50F|nr:enterotoxin [Opitutus sp. ER46]PTX98400.1 enterotoxin [Opitutus sp. ER46]